MDRRRFLKYNSMSAVGMLLPGCAWLSPPAPYHFLRQHIPANNGLLVDTHAHFFNGSDLQVKEFIARVVGPEFTDWRWLSTTVGWILQEIVWGLAPAASTELEIINRSLDPVHSAETEKTIIKNDRDKYFDIAIEQTQNAISTVNARLSVRKQFRVNYSDFPDSYEALFYAVPRQSSLMMKVNGRAFDFSSVLRFIVEMFQYRYVSAHNFLSTYNTSGRKHDLVISHMVDYDWFLANGRETPSSIRDQMLVMGQLAKVSHGLVHYFIPYCPLRKVVYDQGKNTGNQTYLKNNFDPLELVKDAVNKHGALGIKLYPPMGFGLINNRGLASKYNGLWKEREFLPDVCQQENFPELLDNALHELYRWCIDNGVPIMAHTAPSNLSDKAFRVVYDTIVLSHLQEVYPDLNINFGHFGGFGWPKDDSGYESIWNDLLPQIIHGQSAGHRFVDTGFFSSALETPGAFKAKLIELIEKNPTVAKSMMYGTDWKMLVKESGWYRYLSQFEKIIGEPEIIAALPEYDLSCIWGENAMDFLGLRVDDKNYNRMLDFYTDRELPHWFKKA